MTRPSHPTEGVPRCKFHCSRCDAHFRSEAAFMAHHGVSTGTNRLGAKTRDVFCLRKPRGKHLGEIPGICFLTKGEAAYPCSIWSSASP